MSEIVAPPGRPEDALVSGSPALNEVLADFRRWYEEAVASNGEVPGVAPPAVDLATLLGHFVALRQEVNLQTRSVRAQQEQTVEFARDVQESIETLARRPVVSRSDNDDPVKPLLKSLVDVYDALATSGQQIQKVRSSLMPALSEVRAVPASRPSFWARLFGASPAPPPEPTANADRIRAALDGLVTGYTMSLERLDRVLRQHNLEPIAALGQTFDPELMEAMDTVQGSGRPSGEVVEEVRRGYLLNERVFRYAQVRVARD